MSAAVRGIVGSLADAEVAAQKKLAPKYVEKVSTAATALKAAYIDDDATLASIKTALNALLTIADVAVVD